MSPRHRARIVARALVASLAALDAAATTIVVDSTADDMDLGPNGNCTLREALAAANLNLARDACPAGQVGAVATDRVEVPAGVYTLAIAGYREDAGATGDLDVFDAVDVVGAGQSVTVVDGGGLDRVFHLMQAAISISDLTIRGGDATYFEIPMGGGESPLGGGVLTQFSPTVSLTDVTIRDCSALAGGGLQNLGGTATLVRATIVDNTAPLDLGYLDYESGFSGGIGTDWDDAVTIVIDSTIANNVAELGGAGISSAFFGLGGAMEIHGSTISGNLALGAADSGFPWPPTGGAAGILNDGPMILSNSTVSGNVAMPFTVPSLGGGVVTGGFTGASVMEILSSTITGNESSNYDAIYFNTGTLSITSSIIDGACGTVSTPIVSGGGNLESPGATCGLTGPGDQSAVPDPGLGPLGSNGGPTETHALLAGSPAIDAGGATCPPTDQRGVARPLDGDGDTTAACDAGAFEVDPAACPDADGDGYGAPASALCAHPELDCDDADPAVNPGAVEVPGNGLDDDCDPTTPTGCVAASIARTTVHDGAVSDLTSRHVLGLVSLGVVLASRRRLRRVRAAV